MNKVLQTVWTKPWIKWEFEMAGIEVSHHSTLEPVEQIGPIWWTTEAATWSQRAGFETHLVAPNWEDFLSLSEVGLLKRSVSAYTVGELAETYALYFGFVKPADSKISLGEDGMIGAPKVGRIKWWGQEVLAAGVPAETQCLASREVDFVEEWRCWWDGESIREMAMYRQNNETWDETWPHENDPQIATWASRVGEAIGMPCVIDVGYFKDGSIDTVELNPVWSSGPYTVDYAAVYDCIAASFEWSLEGKGREWEPDAWLASKQRLW